jgi:plastocyanin
MAIVAAACGGGTGGSGGGSSPTGPSAPGGSRTTITIDASGVSPAQVRIDVGQQVDFVNRAPRGVEVTSDPHPTHELCPPINQLGMVASGQTRTVTFTQRGTCTYHDHTNPDDARFRGAILIGVNEPGPAPDYRTSQ